MKENKIRILIITDSLGCPREETHVENTWPDMILQKWSNGNVVIYTQCSRGLSAGGIDYDRAHWLMPDIIICQIGVVDCTRRIMTRTELAIISRIPGINKIVRSICSKHMYKLTHLRNKHYTSEKVFRQKMQSIINYNQCEVYFIEIAPASEYMKKKVYHFEDDVCRYNNVFKKLDYINGGGVIEAYKNEKDVEKLFLSDGHHLTSYGTNLVYRSVDRVIKNFVDKTDYKSSE